jgi:hypothetical protein
MKAHTFFALICFSLLTPSLFGQTNAPADTNSIATNQVPASQASDDVIKKLSGLVHDGKYAEAQQLASGLLLAYPDDQRLIKAKTLLDKLIVASNSSQPTNSVAQPVTNATSEQFTGMDKVEYNSLIEMAKEAQQNTDLDQQKASLKQFMDESGTFLQKYPDQMLLWEFRVAAALILDDPDAGYEAGQKLLAAGAADSNDPNLQQLIAKLKIKGWLDKQEVQRAKNIIEFNKEFGWVFGTWKVVSYWNGQEFYSWQEVFTTNLLTSDMRGTIHDSGQISWERYYDIRGSGFSTTGAFFGGSKYYPTEWQPVISCKVSGDKKTMTMLIPSQYNSKNSKEPWHNPVTLNFTKVSDLQTQP